MSSAILGERSWGKIFSLCFAEERSSEDVLLLCQRDEVLLDVPERAVR